MRPATLTMTSVLVLLTSTIATAQTSHSRLSPQVSVSRRLAPVDGIQHHSSTAYEGALRGEAALLTAYGEYLQDESQAAYTWQHVESMHYDNKLKKTATVLARKQMLADYREHEREFKRARRESISRAKYERELEAAISHRLDEFEFNWANGTIYWPSLVAGPRYEIHRQKLNVLMNRLIRYGEANHRYQQEITEACNEFRKELIVAAEQDHPSTRGDYLAMQRFLKGLKSTPLLMAQTSMSDQLAQN